MEKKLRELDPSLAVEVDVVRTTGDRILDVPLARIGEQGLFTKELDNALLSGDADVAVHSLKDVPTRLPDGLVLSAVLARADSRDVLITRKTGFTLATLPDGARVGTSSLRRRSQLLSARPDLVVDDLRGNLNSRLARLEGGDYDAIILAAAGVMRLGWEQRIDELLSPPEWLPAVGQGALAVVTRSDSELVPRLRPLNDAATLVGVTAERAFLRAVEGGCQIPVAALGSFRAAGLRLDALIASLDGSRVVRSWAEGVPTAAEEIGSRLARELLDGGGREILAEVRRSAAPAPPFVGP